MRLNGGAIGALQNFASGLIIQISPQAEQDGYGCRHEEPGMDLSAIQEAGFARFWSRNFEERPLACGSIK